jgi:hypothetical protein
MQNRWASIIEPIISKPQANSLILKNVALTAGTNVINHRLGRSLQGWNPTRVRAAATIYDNQDANQTPQLTLVLISSVDVIVDLLVF